MSKESKEIYEFGPFRLDVGEHVFERSDGTKNGSLPEKAFQTLVVLVRNCGRLVTKDELLDAVWPDTAVEENNLDKAIHAIRHALSEKSSDQKYIETVRKHGYRFVADVNRVEDAAHLSSTGKLAEPDENGGGNDQYSRPENAFQAYQLARYHFNQMTPPDLMRSRALLEEAVRLDPGYAPAYAALAEQSVQEVVAGLREPAKSYPEAREALRHAVGLDPDSVDVHTAAGFVELLSNWDFAAAERSLKKALRLNPHHAFANCFLGQVYMFQSRPEEAAPYFHRAAELDPMNLAIQNLLPISCFLAGKYQDAIRECERMLAVFPRFIVAAWIRCWALAQTGRADEAVAEYEKMLNEPHGEVVYRWIGYAYAAVGEREKALETAEKLVAEGREHYLSPTHLAQLYAALNETELAIHYLEKGVANCDPWMLWIAADPRYHNLRRDRRFDGIVKFVLKKGTPVRKANVLLGPENTKNASSVPLRAQITPSGQHVLMNLPDWQASIGRLGAEKESRIQAPRDHDEGDKNALKGGMPGNSKVSLLYGSSRRYLQTGAVVMLIGFAAIGGWFAYGRLQSTEKSVLSAVSNVERASADSPAAGADRSPIYDLYVRGKVKVASENREETEAAIKLLEQAVSIDPNFAEAYAQLARGYNTMAFKYSADADRKRYHENAEVAIEKALALNPNLAEGHFARGLILWTNTEGFPHEQAIQSYKRSLALDPNLDETHHQLSLVYSHIGLLEEAQRSVKKTLELNPNNTLARYRAGVYFAYHGKFDEAIAIYKTIPRDFTPLLVDRSMAEALIQVGRMDEAEAIRIEYLNRFPQDEGGSFTSVRALLLARAGREKEAEDAIRQAAEIGRGFGHFHHAAYNIASAYAVMNRPEEAVKWLETTAERGFPNYPYFSIDPNLENIRNHPRYKEFMTGLRLEWERYRSLG